MPISSLSVCRHYLGGHFTEELHRGLFLLVLVAFIIFIQDDNLSREP
jgi:hypothetical protein